MQKLETIEEVAETLGDGGPFNPDVTYETVEELVDALLELGSSDEVFSRHDDHLGLKGDLSKEFLKSRLTDINNPKFEADKSAVLEQANIIIPLSGISKRAEPDTSQ